MTLASLSKMVASESEGWLDIARIHPSVARLFAFYVVPLSLIPPLMYAYAQMVHPGAVFELVEPPLSVGELATVGGVFFLIELANVALMAAYIQQLSGMADARPDYAAAYALAAIAPTPLWLSALALFVPSFWFNALAVLAAWAATVALIRHGVRPLLNVADEGKAHRLANAITAAGVAAWLALLLVFLMLLGMALGWR